MQYISFTKGNWEQYFDYAYTWRFPETPKFVQEEDCIVNTKDGIRQNGCDFTSILLKDRYSTGTKISFTASFESYGAPLLVIAENLDRDENGTLRFGNYQEVVLWEKGVNIWDFHKLNDKIQIDWLLRNDFPVEAGRRYKVTVQLEKRRMKVWVEGHYFALYVPSLPEKVHLGITACEGINRFYDLEIECP